MPETKEGKLINQYLKGDEKSLEVLIHLYLKPIYSFVYKNIGNSEDAQDVTQEVFVKVWRNLKKFDKNKSFKTWIFNIAKNTSIDWLRKKKTISFSDLNNDKENNLIDTAPSLKNLLEQKDTAKMLNLAMDNLSSEYRMVLILRYNDHFNFREIAETLGESINTVKSRHRRALNILKKIITKS